MQKILILVDTSRASGRKFLAGIDKYTSAFADWQVFVKPPNYMVEDNYQNDLWLRLDQIDGIIARDALETPYISKILKPKVINNTQRELIPGCSTIVTASEAIGKIAAEYFLSLGFRNFAYCGFQGLPWSQKRLVSYKEILKANGISEIYEYQNGISVTRQDLTQHWKISEWLKQLPYPVCVLACNDDRAVYILEACKIANLNVPEEVAVLGVDNDELVCNLSSPSLSSIELDFEKAGFRAAQHLNELIQQRVECMTIYVSPLEIIKRQSTDVLAINDKDVVNALIFIRKNFKHPIQAIDVVEATQLSRRELEKRFKKILKRTIKKEIERLRVELIKKKLANSNQSVCQIAGELEFTDPEHFSRYFKNATGQSPLQFRRKL